MCKAHLIQGGTPPSTLQSSHAYVAKQLPLVIRQQVLVAKQDPRKVAWVVQHTRHLAKEIEVLNPAVDRNGQRPDNCEYPWENGNGVLRSPLDWTFSPAQLLTAPAG